MFMRLRTACNMALCKCHIMRQSPMGCWRVRTARKMGIRGGLRCTPPRIPIFLNSLKYSLFCGGNTTLLQKTNLRLGARHHQAIQLL